MQSSSYRIFDADVENSAVGPILSNVRSSANASVATVTWDSNDISDGYVLYSTDAIFSSIKEYGNVLPKTTSHSVEVGNLNPSTTYYFKVKSTNLGGGVTILDDSYSFTTAAAPAADPVKTPVSGGGGVIIIDKNDKIAPIISSVSVSDVRAESAAVTWNTNEAANSFVEILIPATESKTVGIWSSFTEHEVKLSNLKSDTVYNIRALSADGSGNLASSSILEFKTASAISDEIDAKASSTEEDPVAADPAKPQVIKPVGSKSFQEALNSAMEAITKYGNRLARSELEVSMIQYLNVLKNVMAGIPGPVVTDGPKVRIADNVVEITWQTNKDASSQVAWAAEDNYNPSKNDPYAQVIGNTELVDKLHKIEIYGLESGKTYHYQLRNRSRLDITSVSEDYTFKTLPKAAAISNYYIDVVSPEKAVFRWLTNKETDTNLRITPYRNEKLAHESSRTFSDGKFSMIHQVEASELESGTAYMVELSGKTTDKEIAARQIDRFLSDNNLEPPKISMVKAEIAIIPGKQEQTQSVITWDTDKSATTKVYFKSGAVNFDIKDADFFLEDSGLARRHVTISTKLKSAQAYSYKVESVDASGRGTVSETHTILIPTKPESALDQIFKVFKEMFGWMKQI